MRVERSEISGERTRLACWFRRRAETIFSRHLISNCGRELQKKFAIARDALASTPEACATLSADSLVMAEAALPHEPRPQPRQQEPASLDGQRLNKISSF